MITIGITGGMGSGKSVVSRLMEIMGIPVYSADTESKRLTDTSPEIKKSLIASFGPELYAGDTLNKPLLASLIFSDKENLEKVNQIIHPVVLRDFQQWIQRQKSEYAAIESAILFESGFNCFVDYVITVTCPTELRIQRVIRRDHLTREQIIQRMNNQLPEEEKCQRSDFVILNDGREGVVLQVEKIIVELKELRVKD